MKPVQPRVPVIARQSSRTLGNFDPKLDINSPRSPFIDIHAKGVSVRLKNTFALFRVDARQLTHVQDSGLNRFGWQHAHQQPSRHTRPQGHSATKSGRSRFPRLSPAFHRGGTPFLMRLLNAGSDIANIAVSNIANIADRCAGALRRINRSGRFVNDQRRVVGKTTGQLACNRPAPAQTVSGGPPRGSFCGVNICGVNINRRIGAAVSE
jgi:hypothetical protein